MGNKNSIGVEHVCYIHSQPIATILNLITIEFSSGNQIPEKCYEIKNVKEFIENLPPFLQIKSTAVFLNVFNFTNPVYKNNIDFCQALNEKFLVKKMYYRFVSNEAFLSTALLNTFSKIIPFKEKEIVVIITVNDEISFTVVNLVCRENQFEFIDSKCIPQSSYKSTEELEAKILENGFPEKVITFVNSFTPKKNILMKDLKKAIKNVEIIDESFDYCISKALIEMVYFIDNSQIWHRNINVVLPYSNRQYYVTNVRYSKSYDDRFITVEIKDHLPVIKKCTVPRSTLPYYVAYVDLSNEISPYICNAIPEVTLHHRLQLTLNIDINGFAKLNQEPIILPEAKTLLTFLPKKFKDEKIPVIAFFDNSSIIYIWKNNSYQFLDTWNGLYGTDLYISFLEEKLAYFDEAKDIWLEKSSFVVYDILNIMSMGPQKIITNLSWGFEIKSDLDNPVLLEFDTFDGTRNRSTPKFLMALLLKQHLKAIQKEMGTKPPKIGLYFFDHFDNKTFDRLKIQFNEAATDLNIDCYFVDTVINK